MAILYDGPVEPDAQTTFVRQVPISDEFTLNQILPDRMFQDVAIDFEEIVRTNRAARFRTYDGRLHVSTRDAGSTKRVKLPPLSTSYNMGEYERLQFEFSRTGGTRTGALATAIYNDSENGTREVQARMELARGDTLTDFKFTMMQANGEPPLESDFGAPAGHLVAPAVLWSNVTTATPLTDLVAWRQQMVNDGVTPVGIRLSLRMRQYLQRNKEVIDAVFGATQGRTRVRTDELNGLLQSEGLPPVDTYDAKVDVDGATVSVIPDDRVLVYGANVGYTAWGISATALELVNSNQAELSFEDAPGIVGVVEKDGPPYRQFTYVDAVGMPIISNPRALLVADAA